jgi:beta-glucanase (GH16 family)
MTSSRHLLLAAACAASLLSGALPGRSQSLPGNWKLTFSEEFDGKKLDDAKWRSGYHFNAVINKEKQHYVPDNVIFDSSGILKLKAEKRTVTAPPMKFEQPYASGAIETWDRFAQTYGLFEARIKMPSVKGLWAAFWLMPDRGRHLEHDKRMSTHNGGMEFDIAEYLPVWGDNYHTAMIYDGYGPKKRARAGGGGSHSPRHDIPGISEEFHTYSLYWEKGRAMFFVDGRLVDGWQDERVASVPMHIILCLAVGGQWPETYGPVDDAGLPDAMEVDWVRVYSGTIDPKFPIPDFDNFPYAPGGTPAAIPGIVQAEHWNYGKAGKAFHDSDTKSEGSFRSRGGVDAEPEYVTRTAEGEWLNYTVRVAYPGKYRLTARGRSATPASVEFLLNGQPAPLAVLGGDWGKDWTEKTAVDVELPAGDHLLTLRFTGKMDLDSVRFEAESKVAQP